MSDVPDGMGEADVGGQRIPYAYQVVNAGRCCVPGCTREALLFCDEHRPARAQLPEPDWRTTAAELERAELYGEH